MYDRENRYRMEDTMNAGRLEYTENGMTHMAARRCDVVRISVSGAVFAEDRAEPRTDFVNAFGADRAEARSAGTAATTSPRASGGEAAAGNPRVRPRWQSLTPSRVSRWDICSLMVDWPALSAAWAAEKPPHLTIVAKTLSSFRSTSCSWITQTSGSRYIGNADMSI